MIFGVEGVCPARRAQLVELLDIDLYQRITTMSDGQKRRVQIAMGLLKPYQVGWAGGGAGGGVMRQKTVHAGKETRRPERQVQRCKLAARRGNRFVGAVVGAVENHGGGGGPISGEEAGW